MSTPHPEEEMLRAQLANAVALAAKQDQITWAICTVYVGASSVLMVALFPEGHLAPPGMGMTLCGVAVLTSFVLLRILGRALDYFDHYEKIVKALETKLGIRTEFSLGQRVPGDSSRKLLMGVGRAVAGLWVVGLLIFGVMVLSGR